ncbi:putative rho guanine nucleotide exchange factor 8-like [Capsicum annuum]|nr:putative rho guanine nucleotide exchange factor 8-like [Capsicum annuum]
MPPESLRSAVYRSFVTCDDPRGVVECKTIRKSKIADHPKMDKNVVKQRTCNHLKVSSSSDKEEGRETVCKRAGYNQLNSSSSLQLTEVSREVQKLNQVIDSWSNGMSSERHSKDIAKDLLKGALDLQDSLVMLGELQEASQHMAKLKKKQKDKPVKHGIAIQRTKSERISDERLNRLEFQKPRFSVDGASQDCFDELREVIRDSFAIQNLLPPSCASEKSQFETRKVELSPGLSFARFTTSGVLSFEKACVGRRKMIISSDIPSASSSHSSIVQSQEITCFDYSPTLIEQEKPDGPNLIARLMGLEQIPRKPQHQTSQKHIKNDRVVKKSRPIFEIDLPKAKKPTFLSQKVDPERRALDEIIETMHFKGLLRSKSMDKSNHGTNQSSLSGLLNRFVDSPAIVIMKPRYALDSQGERFPPCNHEENPSGTRNTIGKWDSKEKRSPENSDDQKGTLSFTIYKKLQAGKDQNNKFSKEKWRKDHGEASEKSKTLEVLIQEKLPKTKITTSPGKYRGEAPAESKTFDVLSQEKQRKTKIISSYPRKYSGEAPANSNTLEILFQEKHPNAKFRASSPCKYSGEAPANSKTAEVLIQGKRTNTMTRASSTGKTRQPKKEAIGNREDGTQLVAPAIRNSKEMKNAKTKDTAKFQDQSKMSVVKVRKPERKPLVAQEKSTITDPKRITTTASHNSIKRTKNVKVDKLVKSTSIAEVDNMEHKDENVEMVQSVAEDTNIATTEVTSSEELQLEKGADIFENVVTDNTVNGESFPCESSVPLIHCVADIKLVEHINCNINVDFTENENLNSRSTTRYLLLSSESFLCRSEELFETDVLEPTIRQTTSVDHEIVNSAFLLDCAKELLEHKRSQCALAVDPLSLKAIKMRKFSVSFDKLVSEICDGIEVLRSHDKAAGKNLSADAVNSLLERDLWCKGVASSAWDLGWRTGLTNNEVEEVVTDIEKYLLTAFIDDLLADFMLYN